MSNKIMLTTEEYDLFERFFQYGDLKSAELLFVGYEEGLGRATFQEVVEEHLEWPNEVPHLIGYLDESKGLDGGWYIKDNPRLLKEYILHKRYQGDASKLDKIDMVMRSQSRITMKFHLGPKFEVKGREPQAYFVQTLHGPQVKSAMIDLYPLPRQKSFPYVLPGVFQNRDEYIAYNDRDNNPRRIIIEHCYNYFHFDVSIVYAGMDQGQFKAVQYYTKMGFKEVGQDVLLHMKNEIHRLNLGPMKITRKFLIMKRKRDDGHIQWAIHTPFFGNGQISNDDVDAIATWVYYLKNYAKYV